MAARAKDCHDPNTAAPSLRNCARFAALENENFDESIERKEHQDPEYCEHTVRSLNLQVGRHELGGGGVGWTKYEDDSEKMSAISRRVLCPLIWLRCDVASDDLVSLKRITDDSLSSYSSWSLVAS